MTLSTRTRALLEQYILGVPQAERPVLSLRCPHGCRSRSSRHHILRGHGRCLAVLFIGSYTPKLLTKREEKKFDRYARINLENVIKSHSNVTYQSGTSVQPVKHSSRSTISKQQLRATVTFGLSHSFFPPPPERTPHPPSGVGSTPRSAVALHCSSSLVTRHGPPAALIRRVALGTSFVVDFLEVCDFYTDNARVCSG